MKKKGFQQQSMVKWYDVKQLALTGLRSVISGVFGNYSDRREIQAALDLADDNQNHVDRAQDEIWVDYISDLGDGFNSTYTMADLLAQEKLMVHVDGINTVLPSAKIIIMGGDEVYPTPSLDEYNRRTKYLYEAAFPENCDETEAEKTYLYAIPGNHDWYDGLGTFLKLFTQGRKWGRLHTRQSRSYFAIKLTENVWLWGLDVQLNSEIDQPQLSYFQGLKCPEKMKEGDKVILCTAEPSWVFHTHHLTDYSYERLTYFQRKCIDEQGLSLIATLTGDLHHYSHYTGVRTNGKTKSVIHNITAGGGGAFLHPTHFLKEKLTDLHANGITEELGLQARFPNKDESHTLAFKNFLFPFLNPGFGIVLGTLFLIIVWMLQSSVPVGDRSLISQLAGSYTVKDFVRNTANFLQHSPMAVILVIILVSGFIGFADNQTGEKGKKNHFKFAGAIHGILQVLLLFFFLWGLSRFNYWLLGQDVSQIEKNLANKHTSDFGINVTLLALLIVELVGVAGFLGSFLMGCYLFCSTYFFHIHYNEAFSSFRYEGYKNFLRIHVAKNKVTIYPIGVRNVTTQWETLIVNGKCSFKGKTASYELIDKPIEINLS
ncbi:metallophosphoesterase [Xanthocytophaga flava]|uniref:metallophosphoesterase n=1 Tax=Xanthocytophaga flava TaxID=3048013 RepID=UPI0028D616A2|nr:metallophosphoesterase [Xanthocytophaga flavus]MDJ1473059.1 metallophosphoesterase [Xanthocytophaga flavus]